MREEGEEEGGGDGTWRERREEGDEEEDVEDDGEEEEEQDERPLGQSRSQGAAELRSTPSVRVPIPPLPLLVALFRLPI